MIARLRRFYDDRDTFHDPVSHALILAMIACLGGMAWCLVALAAI